MKIGVKDVKYNCRYFRGDIPCTPQNQYGVYSVDEQRKDCPYYYPTDNRILIIKLGAIGDVIRTSPLLRKLKEVDPHAEIWWLTLTPEVLSKSIDVIIPVTP
jgi:heptosyltransferase-2